MKKVIIFLVSFVFLLNSMGQNDSIKFEMREFLDISYVESDGVEGDSLQQLNLVLPKEVDLNVPLLIWIGGGAWSYVNKDMEMDIARELVKEGIAVASVGHRLSPAIWRDSTMNTGVEHPSHVKDIAMSIKWLYDRASEYGYDKEQIFVGGFSSGGHLSALVSLDGRYLSEQGLPKGVIKGVIPMSGTYDMVDYYETFLNGNRPTLAKTHVKAVFGQSEEQLREASPINYIEDLALPMLLITDANVYNYTKIFEEELIDKEYQSLQVIYAYHLSHGDLWRNLAADESIYRDMMVDFIKRNI